MRCRRRSGGRKLRRTEETREEMSGGKGQTKERVERKGDERRGERRYGSHTTL